MTNIKRKNSKIRHMGLFLILAVIIPVFIQKYETFNYHTIENQALSSFFDSFDEIEIIDKKRQESSISSYIAVLEIPSIRLRRGLTNPESKYNYVDYNVQIINGSNMPDENKNLILAAHSGYGRTAFFKNLDKLRMNDYAFIYYYGKKYKYVLNYNYSETKNGTITISRDITKSTLTLTTCNKYDDSLQDIYIFYLVSIEDKEEF